MPILEGITATKAALDVSRAVLDLLNRPDINAADIRAKVNELLMHVVNAQVALGDAHVELSELRRQLDDRQELNALQVDMDFVTDGQFYVKKSEKEKGLIPYCPVCWSADRKAVHLGLLVSPGSFNCCIHNTRYFTQQYETAMQQKRASGDAAYRRANRLPDI
jgi:hypothetical protein